MLKILVIVGVLGFSNFVFAAQFGPSCAEDASDLMGGADSPFTIHSDGSVAIDPKSKCKPSFDKTASNETYSFTCPQEDPRLNTLTQVIKIKRDDGSPVKISNSTTWKGKDSKSSWQGTDSRSVAYSYGSGSCVVDRKEFTPDHGKKTFITYDKGVCEQINKFPGLKGAEFAKCSALLEQVGTIVKDYNHEVREKSKDEGKIKEFAYSGVKDMMKLITKCQAHGLPDTGRDGSYCPECMVNPPGAKATTDKAVKTVQ